MNRKGIGEDTLESTSLESFIKLKMIYFKNNLMYQQYILSFNFWGIGCV